MSSRVPGAAPSTRARDHRRDIQFVRAVAVGVVLVYHLWPERVPGGFIGVDVFFVISGFLITAHLLRDAQQTGAVRLLAFWGRRALRLLPLATAVLIATAVAVAVWAPPSTWRPALEGIIASTFYVQNWTLAAGAVDYLARDQAPLPTQHFWSLSVEEQFYLVWPVLLIGALALAALITRRSRSVLVRPTWAIAIAVVGVASFAYSVWLTSADPGLAYFSTATRAWQFAAGAGLAFVPVLLRGGSRPRRTAAVSAVASWLGLLLVLAGSVLITGETPFPGVAALIPVAGAVLLLWSGTAPVRFTPATFGNVRIIERIGDLSYGIYLWHWPLIVLAPSVLARPLTLVDKLVIALLSVVLAELSKRAIEDPFRFGTIWHRSTWRRFVPGFSGMALAVVSVLLASSILGVTLFRSPTNPVGPSPTVTLPSVGPIGPSPGISAADLQPAIPDRGVDYAVMYDCFDFDASGPYRCEYGVADAEHRIAIVGDSHAAHWIPGLVAAAETEGWSLTTFVGMNCDGLLSPACSGGGEIVQELVGGDFDIVLFSAFRASSTPLDDVHRSVEALVAGVPTLVLIADVPLHPRPAFECLDANFRNIGALADCSTPRDDALLASPDRVAPLAVEFDVPLLDFTETFCDAERCPSILGSIVVYQDSPSSHLTTTMSTALSVSMIGRLRPLLGRG